MSVPHTLLFGDTHAMAQVLIACEEFATTKHPVLIVGEPGTGKTALAHHIHGLSGRKGPLINGSMVSVPPNLEHSHLAGHIRGAFTGADSGMKGLVEAAHGGTLFLDELGLASPIAQGILLQLLDEGTLRKVGETRVRPVDTRLLAATNADLEQMCEMGTFRRDLLTRFGFFQIRLPPLRERRDEILPLIAHFLKRECILAGREDIPVLSPTVQCALREAYWRDNIREVEMLCKYFAVHRVPDSQIEMCDLPPGILKSLGTLPTHTAKLSLAKRAVLELKRAKGNKTQAARALGVSRRHLYRLLRGSEEAT